MRLRNVFRNSPIFGVAAFVLALGTALGTALWAASPCVAGESGRTTTVFNDGWTFYPVAPEDVRSTPIRSYRVGDKIDVEKTGEGRAVRLPHDWAIEGGFDKKYGTWSGAAPWNGVGIYRKTVKIDKSDAGKRFVLDFDGCMSFPEVSVDGVYVGGWDYGYLGFQVDLTPYLDFDVENEISVRCDTREHRSRWYPGAGIYRNVNLIVCSRDAWFPEGAVWVESDVEPKSPTNGSAKLTVDVAPEFARDLDGFSIELTLRDPDGNVAFAETKSVDAKKTEFADNAKYSGLADAPVCATFAASFDDAPLWDVDSPKLWRAVAKILDANNVVLDEIEISFGLRKAEWTVDDGFHLNGRRVQLRGVDLHHDQGIIGAASHPAAIRRQLAIMRDMGVNAIRTSHNPNSTAFMDACDELGFVVWDELFDKWDGTAGLRPEDDFFEFAARQARRFVRRDRNRPSVCAWSIGNEIASIERDAKDASNPERKARERVAFLADAVRKYDPTRRVGMGCFVETAISPENNVLAPLDLTGWNYGAKYRPARDRYPETPLVYTESASAFSTRGYYDAELRRPSKKDEYDDKTLQVDSFDLISANGPRDIPDIDFERMNVDKYVAGEFVWTGFDYLGEPAPFEKEAKSGYFGIVDLCGLPKDRFYLYRSYWNEAASTVWVLPHWNWPERVGKTVPVYVYTSGDSAELFLNGESLGKRTKDASRSLDKPADADFDLPEYYWIVDKYRLRWENVEYEPGELVAVAYKDGKEIGRRTVRTAGAPVALRLTPEKTAFESDDDLVYATVEAVDANGTVCPLAETPFEIVVDGPAKLAGAGNGNPLDYDSFADSTCSLFFGKAIVAVRSETNPSGESVKLTIRADGFPDSTVEIGRKRTDFSD